LVLSTVGHFLGLTPSASEVTDRPEGWVSRHYQGVFWGYVLTVLLIAAAVGVIFLALFTQDESPGDAASARYWLPRVAGAGGVLLVMALALPIGERPGVKTAEGESGTAREGNVPNVEGISAATAERALEEASLTADFGGPSPLNEDRCVVVDQEPEAGGEVDEYGAVRVRCKARVPKLVGKKADTAESRLMDAGFESRLFNEPADYDLSRCRVRSQKPTGRAAPYTTVRLTRNPRPNRNSHRNPNRLTTVIPTTRAVASPCIHRTSTARTWTARLP
jgi:hypothetical protein